MPKYGKHVGFLNFRGAERERLTINRFGYGLRKKNEPIRFVFRMLFNLTNFSKSLLTLAFPVRRPRLSAPFLTRLLNRDCDKSKVSL